MIKLKLTRFERETFMKNLYFRNHLMDKFDIEIVERFSDIALRDPSSPRAFEELLTLAGEPIKTTFLGEEK